MIYTVIILDKAKRDIESLKKSEILAYNKVAKVREELREHPHTGTGKPEYLTHLPNTWSRRITKKHRLVYSIHDGEVKVLVLSAKAHYDDK
ncbi:MAG: Txe/YoeB family addiction module toxin [Candidatus Azobacteroides sp.]|nr:Txe/YoeB family addiction module toxin [Candidatus Azobacteroides sp.]